MATVKRAMPFFRPVLKLFGVEVEKIDDAFANIDDLVQQASELASIPDRFNDLFASRGWIIYDFLNLRVAKSAVEKAEAGHIDEAETDLVNYYDSETVKWHLLRMKTIKAFRPRMQLANKALTDYREERYHACVPVVLALLDGLVNELHDKRRGFFADEVDLIAWDSVAAHSKGLNVLNGIFKKGRQKTITDQISIPYRNGIMHGMDLGYDNKIVAAKTWAALFATRDWAAKAESGLLGPQPEEPQLTWGDLFGKIQENGDDKKKLEEWRKREVTINIDIPETGEPDVFADGTPERKLAEFLTFWKARNYGHMANCLDPKFGARAKKNIGLLREVYGQVSLQSFSFTQINDYAPAATEIFTELVYGKDGELGSETARYLLTNADDKGNAQVRGNLNSRWGIVNWEWVHF